MTHLSKKPISPALKEKLFVELAQLVSKSGKQKTRSLLSSILTETEQVMIAKRLAVVVLLHQGVSMYKIVHILQMSISTVVRMKSEYSEGGYEGILEVLESEKRAREKFMKTLGLILRGGMPSMGRDRWEWLDRLNANNRRFEKHR